MNTVGVTVKLCLLYLVSRKGGSVVNPTYPEHKFLSQDRKRSME